MGYKTKGSVWEKKQIHPYSWKNNLNLVFFFMKICYYIMHYFLEYKKFWQSEVPTFKEKSEEA